MEATSELLQKLQRRRERNGERSPLKDANSNIEVDSQTKCFETGRVQQRRTAFEGIENQPAHYNVKPGKLDLGRWEQTAHKEYPKRPDSFQALQASRLDGPIASRSEDFIVAEDPIDCTTPSTKTVSKEVSGVSVVPPPSGSDCIVKVIGDEEFTPVHGMQLCPFPFSGYQIETKHEQRRTPTSPLDQGMQLCPFPSSQCRVVAVEKMANITSTAASTSSIDNDSSLVTSHSFPTIAPVSPEDLTEFFNIATPPTNTNNEISPPRELSVEEQWELAKASVTKEPTDSAKGIVSVASAICPQASHSQAGCARSFRTLPLYAGGLESEFARTEARVAELEAAIQREGQKLREKDAERKAVFREVEAIRCEARAHRAKLNKHMHGTEAHKSM